MGTTVEIVQTDTDIGAVAIVNLRRFIPPGYVFGVTTLVLTTISGNANWAGYNVGISGMAMDTLWGGSIAGAVDTTTTVADFNVSAPILCTEATDLLIGSAGANFGGRGKLRITGYYLPLGVPTR